MGIEVDFVYCFVHRGRWRNWPTPDEDRFGLFDYEGKGSEGNKSLMVRHTGWRWFEWVERRYRIVV